MSPCAPIAQLDRAVDYESTGREFESLWAHHNLPFGSQAIQIYTLCGIICRMNLRAQAPLPLRPEL